VYVLPCCLSPSVPGLISLALQFVEDEGSVVFYKDARGVARRRVVYQDGVSDSGVDVPEDVE
jgi:hypothetical protein